MADSLMQVARREDVQKILNSQVQDVTAAARISDLTGVFVTETEIRTYRKLTSPDFLRASPYADGNELPVAPPPVRKNMKIPEWAGTPGAEVNGDEGVIYTRPKPVGAPSLETTPDRGQEDDSRELREFGFDPEVWEVSWAKRGTWQAQNGDWLESRRLTVKKRDDRRVKLENVSEIFAAYADPTATVRSSSPGRTVVVAMGDTQAGKIDGGGSESLVVRFARIIQEISAWLRETGGAERLILVWAGDCIEGAVSQGGRLVTRLDLSVSEQVRLVQRMIMHQVGVFGPLADQILFLAVPGNHDETHRIAATKPSDSWAIQAASSVADSVSLLGTYEHVDFLFPGDEDLTVAASVGTKDNPFVLAVTHGHQVSGANQLIGWWKGQSHGRQVAGEADLLITGHLHHLRVEQTGGGRTWLQLPAMDGGSLWFTRSRGDDMVAGAVTLEIDPSRAPGWSNMKVWS